MNEDDLKAALDSIVAQHCTLLGLDLPKASSKALMTNHVEAVLMPHTEKTKKRRTRRPRTATISPIAPAPVCETRSEGRPQEAPEAATEAYLKMSAAHCQKWRHDHGFAKAPKTTQEAASRILTFLLEYPQGAPKDVFLRATGIYWRNPQITSGALDLLEKAGMVASWQVGHAIVYQVTEKANKAKAEEQRIKGRPGSVPLSSW